MGVMIEVQPERLKVLRTRLGLPLHAGAEKVKASEEELAAWEGKPTEFTVKRLQQIAKAYNYTITTTKTTSEVVGPPCLFELMGGEVEIELFSEEFGCSEARAVYSAYKEAVRSGGAAGIGETSDWGSLEPRLPRIRIKDCL